MLTEKELKFIEEWELVREEYSSFSSKLKRGLPMAILFSLPIFFSIVIVFFLSPEWYTKIGQKAGSSFYAIIFAILIIILFFSYFRMHFKWELNEQLFEELKIKKNKSSQNSPINTH
jgi:ABC-type multidrug transport system permease subunit